MTPETLSATAGIALSLAFAYIPGLSTWYEALDPTRKRLVMLLALVLVSLGAFGLACFGWAELPVTCDQPGVLGLLQALILTLVANQATFLIAAPGKPARTG